MPPQVYWFGEDGRDGRGDPPIAVRIDGPLPTSACAVAGCRLGWWSAIGLWYDDNDNPHEVCLWHAGALDRRQMTGAKTTYWQDRMLQYVREHPGTTGAAAAADLGIRFRQDASKVLRQLAQKGLVTRTGNATAAFWWPGAISVDATGAQVAPVAATGDQGRPVDATGAAPTQEGPPPAPAPASPPRLPVTDQVRARLAEFEDQLNDLDVLLDQLQVQVANLGHHRDVVAARVGVWREVLELVKASQP